MPHSFTSLQSFCSTSAEAFEGFVDHNQKLLELFLVFLAFSKVELFAACPEPGS
jgi:hypothetical protein